MEVDMLAAAGDALLVILDPYRMMMLSVGVLVGLILGIIPGIGGIVGMALLLPFTFSMDAYTAFAVLLGMLAVINTSDTVLAILFGVPGSSGAQATVMDGYPMTVRGEAGRALSASFSASMIGGLFGAFVLALAVPVLRPFIMSIGSPELLALSVFGISMVSILSGGAPLRGLAIAGFGILLSMIGMDPQTSTLRWTGGQLYLWEGLPLVPMIMGLFALPEIADMAIRRTAISANKDVRATGGMLRGISDTLSNWWLVVRCSSIGAAIGALPGAGSFVEWIAYGHAMQTVKGADKTFGRGDVRGVIATESANNAITSGALIPTIAFGVPATAGMAILLGALLIHGLTPGPEMLKSNLNITYAMIWSVAIANILGAGICFLFSSQFAKIASLRYTLIVPPVMIVIFVGAFQASRSWGDLFTLLIFAALGWVMKQLKWPRPPLLLGFVLGSIIEQYLFISIGRYGAEWLGRPVVVVLLVISALTLLRPFVKDMKNQGGLIPAISHFRRPVLRASDLLYIFFIAIIGATLVQASAWPFGARIAPMIVGPFCLVMLTVSLVYQVFRREPDGAAAVLGRSGQIIASERMFMDSTADHAELPVGSVAKRAGIFLAYLLGFMASMALVGLIPSIPILMVFYLRLEGREAWRLVVPLTAATTAFVYVVFDQLLSLPWPASVLGQLVPALQAIPSV